MKVTFHNRQLCIESDTHEKNCVDFSDNPIFQVKEFEGDKVLVTLNPGGPATSRNIFLLDQKCNVIWQIQGPPPHETRGAPGRRIYSESYSDVQVENGKIMAGVQNGFVYEVDPKTGAITFSYFTKT